MRRAIRLYPVFWLWLGLDILVDPGNTLAELRLAELFLVQFNDPSYKWFLHAIVMCYLVALPLYVAVNRLDRWYLLVSVAVVVAVHFALSAAGVPPRRCLMFLFVFLGNVFLFGFGMYYARRFSSLRTTKSNLSLAVGVVVMAVVFVVTGYMQQQATSVPRLQMLPPEWDVALPLALYASIIYVAVQFFSHARRLPLMRPIGFLGRVSLSVYVFEGMFATALARLGLVRGVSDWNLIPYIVLFPLLAVGCRVLERQVLSGGWLARLWSKVT